MNHLDEFYVTYLIRNMLNNRALHGHCCGPAPQRFGNHQFRLDRWEHKNPEFQADFDKDGDVFFVFEIARFATAAEANACEIAQIKADPTCYNQQHNPEKAGYRSGPRKK